MEELTTSGTQVTPKEFSKNILKKYNIRVFKFNTKYLLVDSSNFAFMMFKEKQQATSEGQSIDIHTIEVVNFYFRYALSTFPEVKRIYFNQLSRANLKYMCDIYTTSCVGDTRTKPFKERVDMLRQLHNITLKFATILAQNNKRINIYEICQDIREAKFYLSNKPAWQKTLKHGVLSEKREILKKLLPVKTYQALRIDTAELKIINTIIYEIINIS